MDSTKLPKDDHDLLIRLETKVDTFISLQNDHEVRIRMLEKVSESNTGKTKGVANTWNWVFVGMGLIVAVIELVAVIILKVHK